MKVPNTALRFRPPGATAVEGLPGWAAQQARPLAEKRPGAAGASAGLVWVLGRDRRPVPVQVTPGITDGTATEIVRGDLTAGQEVLIGLESGTGMPAPQTTPGPGLRL